MKNLFLIIMLACATMALQAQDEGNINKGTWMAGGSVAFSTNSQSQGGTSINNTTFSIAPEAGYFISSKFAFTLAVNFFNNNTENGNSNNFAVQPGIRFYPYKDLFVAGSVGFGTSNATLSNTTFKSNLFAYQAGVGYSIFLNKHVALEPTLIYASTTINQDTQNTNSDFTTQGLTLGIGFRIFL